MKNLVANCLLVLALAWLLLGIIVAQPPGQRGQTSPPSLTLSDAVARAEKLVGGQAVKAELRNKSSTPEFRISLVGADREVVSVDLDANGAPLEGKPDKAKGKGKKDKRFEGDIGTAAKVTLREAIALAERMTGGHAVKAHLQLKGDGAEFKLDLIHRTGEKLKLLLDHEGKPLKDKGDKSKKGKKVQPKQGPAIDWATQADSRPNVYRAGKLPEGLPAWFAELDRDLDGQIGLYEWRRSPRNLDDFKRFDWNDDGFITPEEVLRLLRQSENVTQGSAKK